MQIDWLGELNFHIQFPVRPEGLILLGVYLVLVCIILIALRNSILRLRRREWSIFAGLALMTVVLSNVLIWRFTAPGFQPVPNLPQETAVPATPLFAALPLLLSGLWLGMGPTVLLSALSGFLQAGFQSGQITQRFEVIAYGLIASYLLQQHYRGRLSSYLRQPIVVSVLASFLSWPVMLPSFFVYTPGPALAAFNYAWPLFVAGLIPTLSQGFLSGVVAQVVDVRWPQWRYRSAFLNEPFWTRTLNRRLLLPFIGFTIIAIIILVWAVSMTALGQAKQQAIAQMSRDASSVALGIPSFFQTGQSLIANVAADDTKLLDADPATRTERLANALRIGPYFDQLMLFDATGSRLSYYPADQARLVTLGEQMLISRTLQTGAPQISDVFNVDGQAVVSFIVPVPDVQTGQTRGALLGRASLQSNPIMLRLRDSLQSTLGAGVGYIVSEENQIVVHPDSTRILQAWGFDATQPPSEKTSTGSIYEDRFPDGTPRLLYVMPAQGTNWQVAIELPVLRVLQLALQISTPLLFLLVLTLVVSAVGISFLTRAITRPIQQLSLAAEAIAKGHLDQPVAISGEDEVGRLGNAFEQMRLSLKARVDDLSLLLHVSQTVSGSLDLEQGVPPLLAGAMQASPARVARLVLFPVDDQPASVITSGEGPQSITTLDDAIARLAAGSDLPLLLENVTRARARAMLDPALIGPGLKAIAAFPVRRQARPVAVMWLGYAEPHAFVESEVNILGTLSGQAAVLIENATLFLAAEGGRRRLEAVLTSTNDAVIVTNKENRVLLCNPAAEAAFHLKPAEAVGLTITEVWSEPAMARLFGVDGGADHRTDELLLSDGRTLYGNASAIIGDGGDVIGRVAVLRDITHLKELDTMKSEFVATVSHDLRAPLTYMRGYATMLPMVGPLTPKQKDYAEKVMAGIEQMTELIDDLLDLGRIEAGIGLVHEDCSLANVVRSVVETLTPQALSRGLNLEYGALSERLIIGDHGLLRHAIANLVDNALKYTPPGGKVIVSVDEFEDSMIVSVKDSGIGISPADQVRLFERFYRVKRRETIDIKGSGLGLAIVKSIAEWHHGRVWVDSQMGEGSTFHILIPFNAVIPFN